MMIDRLRQALNQLDQLPEIDQEQLAAMIDEMWETAQLPHFDPMTVPHDDADFDADMAALDAIRGKQTTIPRDQHAVSH